MILLNCSRCGLQPETAFYADVNQAHRLGRSTICKRCYHAAREQRRQNKLSWQYHLPPEANQWLRRPPPEFT